MSDESAINQASQENPHHVNQINLENQSHGRDDSLVVANERRESINIQSPEVDLPDPIAETQAQQIDRPEKFKDEQSLIKAYLELEKRQSQSNLSAAAPDQYEVEISETLEEAGVDIDLEDPTFQQFEKFARESKMSNDQFNECIDIYLSAFNNQQNISPEEVKAYKDAEIAKLGDEGPQIVSQIENWGNNNLSENNFRIMNEIADSSERILFLKEFIDTGSANSSVPTSLSQSSYTREDLKTMMADSKYANDLNYTKKVDDLFKNLWNNKQI